MTRLTMVLWTLGLVAGVGCAPAPASPPLRVLTAASLVGAMQAVGAEFQAETGVAVQVVGGASSSLARQLSAGAPGDVFVSADTRWVTWLGARGELAPCDTADVATNRLVVVVSGEGEAAWRPGAAEPGAPPERLAVGDPEHVPVGRYARESLESLGLWDALAPRIVATADAPAAVSLVARGAVPAAIAYATDARGAPGVRVSAELPPTTHRPILYKAGVPAASTHPRAREFLAFLRGDAAQARLASFGFGPPPPTVRP
ncbi:MAG: molybdate ABC transporter substrate-binding protein [Myxococcota bacterium]